MKLFNKKICLALSLLAFVCNLSAQPYNPSKINKKAVALYTQAMQRAQSGNLALATGLLQQSLEIDNKYLEAYLSLGGVYGQLKKLSGEYRKL